MRPRDARVSLYDVLAAADAIAGFVADRTLDEYRADLLLRSAVERQFEVLGEAMTRALRAEPGIAGAIDEALGVVDFRNVIAHGYDVLADDTVWDVAVRRLPALRETVAGLLRERAWGRARASR
jgi:uncharacterized protein with HEPN domain